MRSISRILCAIGVIAASLSAGEFTSVDINTGLPGSTVDEGLSSYTVRGGGADIWSSQDSFRYVYHEYSGDFDIRTKVGSIEATDPWAKAGVMVRQSSAANSIHAMMVATSANGFSFQYRTASGGTSSSVSGGATGYPFSWVRLIRSGSLVAGYKSTDPLGAEWQFVGSVSLTLADPVLVGLCVTAHNNTKLCKAEFSYVDLIPFVSPSVGGGTGLSAKYFNNKTFSGVPALERVDPELNFNWLTGAPDVLVNADNFSVHWSGYLEPQYSESYTFHTSSDDGIRVWVDGALVLDNWTLHSPQANRTYSKKFVAGERYPVVVEFFENGGGAEAKLLWSSRSTFKQIIPQSQLFPDAQPAVVGEGSGLKGEYFNSRDLSNHALTRLDSTVEFTWGSAAPALTVTADHFSVRWTGSVQPKHTGLYTFYTTSDDGVRLWVNNQLIVNNWTDHSPTENSGVIPLIAGQRYTVRMEYYERTGGAVAKLAWSSADQAKEFVPLTALYPANGSGLFAEYFNDAELMQPVFHRVDSKIDFNWGEQAPDASMDSETFSVRWSGRIEPKYSEAYTFYTDTDEAVRLWVNNQLVIDNWTPHALTENASAPVALTLGQAVEFKMEYADISGEAVAKLSWSSASQAKETIPASQMYPNGGMVVSVPNSSPISPAFIEGTMWSPTGNPFDITCTTNGNTVSVTKLGNKLFYVNVPLQPTSGTAVSFEHSETGVVQSGLVTWATTDISGKTSSSHQMLLRVGDSLLLTGSGTGASMTIDANGDGVVDLTDAPGSTLPFQYNQTGQYIAKAKIDGVLVGEILITVVDVDWRGQIACIVGYARTKNVAVFPANAANSVVFTSADSNLLNVSLKDLTSTGAALFLRPNDRGIPIVVARLGGTAGSVIAHKEIDEYTIDLPGLHEAVVNEVNNTGSTKLTVRPYIPDIRFEFNMFAHTSTFAGGQTYLSVNTSDIDLDTGLPKFQQVYNPLTGEVEGQYVFEIQMPATETMYCFRVNAYQKEDAASASGRSLVGARAQFTDEQEIEPATNVNGVACKCKVEKLVLCSGGATNLMRIPTQIKPNGALHDIMILNCFGVLFIDTQQPEYPNGFDCKQPVNDKALYAVPDSSTGIFDVQIGTTVFKDVLAVVDVTITSDKNPACVGQDVTFTAEARFAGSQEVSVEWSGGGTPPTGQGQTFTTNWTSSGVKTVTATITVSGFEDFCNETFDETIISIKEVTASPIKVCVGDTIAFTAIPEGGNFPVNEPTWTVEGPGTPDKTTGTTIVVTATGVGPIKAIAKCGTSEAEKEAKSVALDKIQYMDKTGTFVDVPNPLIVCKDQSVVFKAIASPAGESFPAGEPKWSGTSGASGSGEIITVTFSESSSSMNDFKTVVAKCGSERTANVLVVELIGVKATDALHPGNSSDSELIVLPDSEGGAYVILEAIVKPMGAPRNMFYWRIDEATADPMSSSFALNPLVRLVPGATQFSVKAGCDKNQSMSLDGDEEEVTLPIYVVVCEIEINNTPAQLDDLVLHDYVGLNLRPGTLRQKTPCRIRLLGAPHALPIELTGSEVAFWENNNSVNSKNLSVGSNWSEFQVVGQGVAIVLNNASVNASVLLNSELVPCASEDLTVFRISGDIVATPQSTYISEVDLLTHRLTYHPSDDGIELTTTAFILPDGVDVQAAPVADLAIGCKQTMLTANRIIKYTDPEVIRWSAAVPVGTTIQIDDSWSRAVTSNPIPIDDAINPGDLPLYDSNNVTTLNEAPLIATTHDSPGEFTDDAWIVDYFNGSGVYICTVKYNDVKVTITHDFRSYAAVADFLEGTYLVYWQAEWSVNVDSTLMAQVATKGAEGTVSSTPVNGPPIYNNSQVRPPLAGSGFKIGVTK